MIHRGDSLKVLAMFPANSMDSVVTDPPAGISFMGKAWDGNKGGRDEWIAWLAEVMAECKRVLKPGGYALVWAIPRTSHWTATAIEDAGFEIRDVITHHFGTGFPKSLDVSKAMDKAAGAKRVIIGKHPAPCANIDSTVAHGGHYQASPDVTAPATDQAKKWQGFGTALKPASEHWILARKPLTGTVAANVAEHGTGALNIDGCRIGTDPSGWKGKAAGGGTWNDTNCGLAKDGDPTKSTGRWPANLVLSHADECADECAPGCPVDGLGESSRFFYCAKASRAEREAGLGVGALRDGGRSSGRMRRNSHPTVKAIKLMRWLVRLVTPPGGTVLDPFAGSGSTGVAAVAEGFGFVGIEREDEYAAIAEARIDHATGA